MIRKISIYLLLLTLTSKSFADQAKCSYGARGSLTAICENANIRFFKLTSYRFDMLDETLQCLNCNLDVLLPNSFDISGNQIQTLDLRQARITAIRDSAFTGLVFMRNLYLQNNSIEELSGGIFKSIKKVQIVDVGYNKIKTISALAFREIANLTTLNLEHNQIESMDPLALAGLNNLKSLNLQFNKLTTAANFSNLLSLKVLNLGNNDIHTVQMGDFENMTALRTLNLANNKISTLNKATFHTLQNLLTLDLSNNSIQTIEPFAFERLRLLEILNLGFNRMIYIKKFMFFDLASLRELHLHNNSLGSFASGLFTGMPELVFLNLSSNKLMAFIGTGNMALSSLHTLDLSYNRLRFVDYKILFRHMPHITYLKLDHNPWACFFVAEIDEYTKEDNVKLSSEGVLTNASCTPFKRHEVEENLKDLQSEALSDQGFAHSHVVYSLLMLMFLFMCGICFVLYKMSLQIGLSPRRFLNTSHANLISNEVHSDDA